ncbi:hypothetical protein ACWCOT_37475 [Nonomuraea bangladeshensis]
MPKPLPAKKKPKTAAGEEEAEDRLQRPEHAVEREPRRAPPGLLLDVLDVECAVTDVQVHILATFGRR